jgi:hypothetical protein
MKLVQNGSEFMEKHKNDIAAANERASAQRAKTPTATAARYDRRIARLVIDLKCRVFRRLVP